MSRIGVVGAAGRMGSTTLGAVAGAEDLELVAAFDRISVGDDAGEVAGLDRELGVSITNSIDEFLAAEPGAVIDFSRAEVVQSFGERVVGSGAHYLVGTTGLGEDVLDGLRRAAETRPETGVLVVPNFCIGVVLMMHFAERAAEYYDNVEIVERHHTGKADSPSGTSLHTAERIAEVNPDVQDLPPEEETLEGCRGGSSGGVRIHSVRLPGVVAEQEVSFGGGGETLTLEQRTIDRRAFMPGVLMALRNIAEYPGFHKGLETVMEGA